MDIAHRVGERAESVSMPYILGQSISLSHRRRKCHRCAHVLCYLLLRDALGQRIDRHERQELLALDIGLVRRRSHSISTRFFLYLSVETEGRAESEHVLKVILIEKGYLAGCAVVIHAKFCQSYSSLSSHTLRDRRYRKQMRVLRLAVSFAKELHVSPVLISARIVAE